MSIAKKLQTVAENELKVCNAGFVAGYDAGFWEGENEGFSEGYESGYDEGYEKGGEEKNIAFADGWNEGYKNGREEGYDAGYDYGRAEGYNQGYHEGEASGIEIGKQAERDAFWDTYQANGQEISGLYRFAGDGWRDSIYNPKHPMKIKSNGNSMYYTSKITNTRVPIDITKCGNNIYLMFGYSQIETIPLLTIGENNGTDGNSINGMFTSCTKLKNITISGVIINGIDLHWSTLLTKESITSFINALSTTTSGTTITFSATAVNNAFGSSTSEEWLNLIATKSNWTISLV